MKMKKRLEPAHREFFLVCDRTTSRGHERMTYYNGSCYRSETHAQLDADAMNARRNVAKAGAITVEYVDRPESMVWSGILRL